MSIGDLVRRVGSSLPTVLRDVNRLVEAGYATDRHVGRNRMIRIATDHPVYTPLREIVLYGYGPAAVLPSVLRSVSNIEHAYIYGSWAQRATGTPGADPRDVDVLIVGNPDPGRLYEVARESGSKVGREVNITIVSPERWEDTSDGFISTVRSRPLVELELS